MRTAPFIIASIVTAGLSASAMAQVPVPRPDMPTGLDCGTPQNALEYYCNHRDQFDKSDRFIGAGPQIATQMAPDVHATGSTVRHHTTTHKAPHRTAHQ